jgi:hypothetical protein
MKNVLFSQKYGGWVALMLAGKVAITNPFHFEKSCGIRVLHWLIDFFIPSVKNLPPWIKDFLSNLLFLLLASNKCIVKINVLDQNYSYRQQI